MLVIERTPGSLYSREVVKDHAGVGVLKKEGPKRTLNP